ncbi:MAG: hypothetical protein V1723_02570 [Candidatus Uhrbacteria bacterium]
MTPVALSRTEEPLLPEHGPIRDTLLELNARADALLTSIALELLNSRATLDLTSHRESVEHVDCALDGLVVLGLDLNGCRVAYSRATHPEKFVLWCDWTILGIGDTEESATASYYDGSCVALAYAKIRRTEIPRTEPIHPFLVLPMDDPHRSVVLSRNVPG